MKPIGPDHMSSLAPIRVPELASSISATELPTILGGSYDAYKIKRSSFVLSFIAHSLAAVALLTSGHYIATRQSERLQQVTSLVTDISPYILPASNSRSGGGGGGGDRDKLPASRGVLPRFSREQITPPMALVRNPNPKLGVEPTVVVPPEIQMAHLGAIGDPLSTVLGPPSNGPGFGGGIGSGSGGGIGSGYGPGVGPGSGGGIGGGLYRVGGGVTAPRVLYAPDPEFSDEARKAKYQGTVILRVVVGADGRTHDVLLQRSLGLGLDEKAIDAVRQWRFEPARKDGVAVAVLVNVEVNFRLY